MRRHSSASASPSPSAMRRARSASLSSTYIALHSKTALFRESPGHAVEDVTDHADAAVSDARVRSDVGSSDRLAWRSILRSQRGVPVAVLDHSIPELIGGFGSKFETLKAEVGEHVCVPGTQRGSLKGRLTR